MRNLLVMSVVAVCIGMLTSDSAMALGGNNGGGKNAPTTSARLQITNNSARTVRFLILPARTAFPSTLGAVEAQSFNAGPGRTVPGPLRDTGDYTVFVVDTVNFATAIRTVGPSEPSGGASSAQDSTPVTLDADGTTVTVASNGVASIVSISP